jgi:hypothetical protein
VETEALQDSWNTTEFLLFSSTTLGICVVWRGWFSRLFTRTFGFFHGVVAGSTRRSIFTITSSQFYFATFNFI